MTENSEMTKQWLKRVHFSSFCSKQTPPQFELHVNLSMEELQEPNTVAGGYDITEQLHDSAYTKRGKEKPQWKVKIHSQQLICILAFK